MSIVEKYGGAAERRTRTNLAVNTRSTNQRRKKTRRKKMRPSLRKETKTFAVIAARSSDTRSRTALEIPTSKLASTQIKTSFAFSK